MADKPRTVLDELSEAAGFTQPEGRVPAQNQPIGEGESALSQASGAENLSIPDHIYKTEEEFGIPAGELVRLAKQESRFRPGVVNKSGYAGLYQMGKDWLDTFEQTHGWRPNPTDPEESTRAMATHYKSMLEKNPAFTGYKFYQQHNLGPGNVRAVSDIQRAEEAALAKAMRAVANQGITQTIVPSATGLPRDTKQQRREIRKAVFDHYGLIGKDGKIDRKAARRMYQEFEKAQKARYEAQRIPERNYRIQKAILKGAAINRGRLDGYMQGRQMLREQRRR